MRDGASPSQNGTVGAALPASWTRTVPTSTWRTCHECVPEEEDVADVRLDREVLVDRPDRHAVGVEDDPVVAGLRDRAAARQRGQAGAPAGPQPAVDTVAVQVRPAAPPAGRDPPGHQLDDLVEGRPVEPGVRRGPPDQLEQLVLRPLLRRRHLGHELLGEHVERGDRRFEDVEVAGPDGRQQRGALDQLVPGQRVQPAGRRALQMVVRSADPLQERADRPRRPDLANELDRPDVDAELQRRRRHQRPQLARPEPGLDQPPTGRRQAPVVGGHQQPLAAALCHVVTFAVPRAAALPVAVARRPGVRPAGGRPARPACGC